MTVARRCLVAVAAQVLLGCGTHESPPQTMLPQSCPYCPELPLPCPSCPVEYAVTLFVQDAVDGGLVNDVTVNGQSCPKLCVAGNGQSCGQFSWIPGQPDGGPLGAGTFSFDLTAPGYGHVVLDVTVPSSNPNPCNCERSFVPQDRDVALPPLSGQGIVDSRRVARAHGAPCLSRCSSATASACSVSWARAQRRQVSASRSWRAAAPVPGAAAPSASPGCGGGAVGQVLLLQVRPQLGVSVGAVRSAALLMGDR